MSSSPKIRTLADLKARKHLLEAEMMYARQQTMKSINPTMGKFAGFLKSKLAPVGAIAAAGLGILIAIKLFGGRKEQPDPLTEAEIRKVVAEEQLHEEYSSHSEEKHSAGFISTVRGFLPFIKIIFPLLQSAFAAYQASRATDIAKDAKQEAETA